LQISKIIFPKLCPITKLTGRPNIDFLDQEAVLTAGLVTESWAAFRLKVSPRIGSADRFITLPNGGQLACSDRAFLDSLLQESPSEGPVAWLEERWWVALLTFIAFNGNNKK
jgi:hypothetical protein